MFVLFSMLGFFPPPVPAFDVNSHLAALQYTVAASQTKETEKQDLGPVCPLFIGKQVKPCTVNQHTGYAKHLKTFML